MIMYDVTCMDSFNSVERWISDISQFSLFVLLLLMVVTYDDLPKVVLVGNKCDMVDDKVVGVDVVKSLCKKHNFKFAEVSAKDDDGLGELFSVLANDIIDLL